jgi:hypothetical protein
MGVLTAPAGLPLWSDYSRFARRHRARIAVLMGLGLLGGLAWAWMQPPTFSASASVALTPVPAYVVPSTTELVPPAVSIDTDAQLMHSPRVLGAVGDALGVEADAASEHLVVTATASSHVLHVTVTAASARTAADAADAAAAAFVDERRAALGALRPDQLRQLRLLVSHHETLLAQEQRRRVVIPAHDELFGQLSQLRTGLQELHEARKQPAVVVRPAEPPRHADYPNAEVPITSGAMLGVIGGCLLGARRDRGRPTGGPVTRRDPRPPVRSTTAIRTSQEYDHAT